MLLREIFASIFIVSGFIALAIGVIGVITFPGFNTRLHASGVGETLGAMLMVAGMIILMGVCITSLKLIIMLAILLLTNPLGTNVILMEAITSTNYHNYNKKRVVGKIDDEDEARDFINELRADEAKESTNQKEFLRRVEREQ